MGIFCCITSLKVPREKDHGLIVRHEGIEQTPTGVPKAIALPQIHPDHSFSHYGWTTVTPNAELMKRYQVLLESSKAFFALPETDKQVFKTKNGSEEGWNVVEGEKEFITIRSLDKAPAYLRDAAAA